ncbi:MAG TPA: phasin [Xanthobacteraceae bacterium]|nr:phasin [Xanthobacteraceae bacterium]
MINSDLSKKVLTPAFDLPKVEVPEVMREFAEKSVQQAKDVYARIKSAAEESTDMLEDTYASATKGATEFNLKALEALRANVNASFDYSRELMGSKTLAEAVELSATHIRKQFESLSVQAKSLSALAQKVATETAEPIKAGMSKMKVQ